MVQKRCPSNLFYYREYLVCRRFTSLDKWLNITPCTHVNEIAIKYCMVDITMALSAWVHILQEVSAKTLTVNGVIPITLEYKNIRE